jgi:hypothetical protein
MTCERSAPGQHSDEVLKYYHLKASQRTRSASRENLFQVRKLRRNSTFTYKGHVERRRRMRHFEVQATYKCRRESTKLRAERKECARAEVKFH